MKIYPTPAQPCGLIPLTPCRGDKWWIHVTALWRSPLAILCYLITAAAADQFGDFTYYDNGTTVTITDYPTTAVGVVVIPGTIVGKPVTSIATMAFANCSGLTSVTIPAGVTSIGNSAFHSCSGLTSLQVEAGNPNYSSADGVLFDKSKALLIQYPRGKSGAYTIPAGVITVGSAAFQFCYGLTSVTFPVGLISIGDRSFSNCTGLTSMTLPAGMITVGTSAFEACRGLTSVTLPPGLTTVGDSAFHYCWGLTSVTIPASVTYIGVGSGYGGPSGAPFQGCSGLTSLSVDEANPNYSSADGVLLDKAKAVLIQYPASKSGAYTIPASVTRIGTSAFSGCIGLTSVTFSDGVTSIANGMFSGCSNLASVTISSGVTSIGSSAFYGCSDLASLVVDVANPNYSSMDGVLFDKSRSLLIQYPTGKGGVYTMPTSVTRIGTSAFSGCGGLTSVTISPSVSTIGDSVFSGCTGLMSVTIPSSVTSIGDYAFQNCSELTSVTIPNSVISIGSAAFSYCGGLTSVTLPTDVTSIGDYAFYGCSGLTSVTIPVGDIGEYAFYACYGLTSVTISAYAVADYAFAYCSGLTSVYFMDDAPGMVGFNGQTPGWTVPPVFDNSGSFTIYFRSGRSGFTTPVWIGHPCFPWQPPQFISEAPHSNGKVGTAYSHSCAAAGTPTPSFAVTAGGLPDGLTMTPAGLISGTPYKVGDFTGTITASNGPMSEVTQNFSIQVRLWWNLATGGAHGTVIGGGSHLSNSTATLTATADPGYRFTGWAGDATGTANPLSVTMTANKAIEAIFAPETSDTDGDGLTVFDELVTYGTDPTKVDTDGDGLTDGWESGLGRFSIIGGTFTWAQARADALAHGGELACFPTEARWNRAIESLGTGGIDNYTGLWIGATDATTEGTWTWVNGEQFAFSQWATGRPSGMSGNTLDYAEVAGGNGAEIGKWYDRSPTTSRDGYILETGQATDPTRADTDSDDLSDGAEQAAGTNPLLADTDGDGLTDGSEVNLTHSNPKQADSNGNGTNDGMEDPDGDGFGNLFELNAGFDPLLVASTPEGYATIHILPALLLTPVQFSFNAASGVGYRIESSIDLNVWNPIEPVIIGQGGVLTRSYPFGEQPKQFFRARRN